MLRFGQRRELAIAEATSAAMVERLLIFAGLDPVARALERLATAAGDTVSVELATFFGVLAISPR